MEHANVEIRLAGSLENTVRKEVSAPEIAVIKALHGHDAVVNIKKSRVSPIDQAAERSILERKYGEETIARFFPGVASKLPTTLAEVGVEVQEETSKKK
jgi:hypothetical protein